MTEERNAEIKTKHLCYICMYVHIFKNILNYNFISQIYISTDYFRSLSPQINQYEVFEKLQAI